MLRPFLMVTSFFAMIIMLHIADIGFRMMLSYLLGMVSMGGSFVMGVLFTLFISFFTAIQISIRSFDLLATLPDFIIQRINFGARPLGDTTNESSHNRFFAASLKIAGAGQSKAVTGVAKAFGLIPKSETK
jgi:hypothetical protein